MTKKRTIIIQCVLLVCVLALTMTARHLSGLLQSQQAAGRWQGESELLVAQVSAFFPLGGEIDEQSIYSLRQSLEQKLVESSIEAPENGSLWIDAYAGRGTVTVQSDRASATVNAYGVGGEFFFFHPLELLSGGYLSGSDLMGDRVVLDRELAWQLFGSTDLAGMQVTIAGQPYLIAGVVERERDFASEKAYGAENGADDPDYTADSVPGSIYLSYSALQTLGGSQISMYEIASASPISGFLRDIVDNQFSGADVIENSGRFGAERLLSMLGEFGTRSMQTSGVIYPYWENAARMIEDWCMLLLALAVVLALPPIVWGVMLAWRGFCRVRERASAFIAEHKRW